MSFRLTPGILRSICLSASTIPALLSAAHFVGAARAAPASPHSNPATLRYLILRCDAPDAPGSPINDADLRLRYDGPAPSVANWVSEISEGQLSFQIVGFRHVVLPSPISTYGGTLGAADYTGKLQEDCTAGATGVDWSSVDGILLHPDWPFGVPNSGATSIIFPTGPLPLRIVTLPSNALDLRTIVHEVGHSLGWSHSGSNYGQLTLNQYDDQWDVMSCCLLVQTLAVNRAAWGWIPAARWPKLAPGTTSEFDLEIIGSGLQGSRLPGSADMIEMMPPGGARHTTAEARIARGLYEQQLRASGVILHRLTRPIDLSYACCLAKLVDTDGNGEPRDAGSYLGPGQRYDDPEGFGIAVLAATANGYHVRTWSGWALDLHVNGSGHVTGVPGAGPCISSDCFSVHGVSGLTASLVPTGDPPAAFRRWSGACTGSAGCVVPLDRATDVTAWFGTEPLLISVPTLPYAVAGRPYADTLHVDVVGGGGFSVTAAGLPAGLALDATTGRITGTPVAPADAAAVLTITAPGGTTVDTLQVAVLPNTPTLADSIFLVRGREQWFAIPADGTGPVGRNAHVIGGTLPSGVGIRADGAIGGIPVGSSVQAVTLGYTLPSGATTITYHIVVLDLAPAISVAPLASDRGIGGRLSQQLTVEGNGPVAWRVVSGGLPPGIELVQDQLRGQFTTEGTFSFDVEARRGTLADTKTMTLTVRKPALTVDDVVTAYLRGAALSSDVADYLDFIGNRNGHVDVGDIRALLVLQGKIGNGGSQ